MQEYRGIGYHINPRTQEIMPTTHSAGTKRLWTSYDDLKAFKRDVDEGWENKKHIDLINEKKEISYKIDSLHRQGISSGFDYEKLQELYRQIGGELIHRKHGGKGWHESPGADGKAPVHKKVAERAQAKHAQNTPMTKENTRKEKYGHFIIEEDRMGNITLWHTYSPKEAFFQGEADQEAIYELLKKGEKEDLENGWAVDVYDNEPRASVLDELLDAAGEDKKWKYYSILDASTGELLETGRNSTTLEMAVEYGIEFIGEEFEDDDWEEYSKMSLDEKGKLKYFMEKSDRYVIVGHNQKFPKIGGEVGEKDYERVN